MEHTRRDILRMASVAFGSLACGAASAQLRAPDPVRREYSLGGLMASLVYATRPADQYAAAMFLIERMMDEGIDHLLLDAPKGVMPTGSEIAMYGRKMSLDDLAEHIHNPIACMRDSFAYRRFLKLVPSRLRENVEEHTAWFIVHPDVISIWDVQGYMTAGAPVGNGFLVEPFGFPDDDGKAFLAGLIAHENAHLMKHASLLEGELRAYSDQIETFEYYALHGASQVVKDELRFDRLIARNARYLADERFHGIFGNVYPRDCLSEWQLRMGGLGAAELSGLYAELGESDKNLKDIITHMKDLNLQGYPLPEPEPPSFLSSPRADMKDPHVDTPRVLL